MPLAFQRPQSLAAEIPIYHITPIDSEADLILKITALGTNKTAVIPTFKQAMVEILPTYFGRVFDENKGYEFKENRLQEGEYFEIGIPNLKEPENLAIFLKNIFFQRLGLSKKAKVALEDDYNWPEFYWIANYFDEENLLLEIVDNLLIRNQSFCHELLVNYQISREFEDKIKAAISKNQFQASEDDLVKRLMEPETVFDISRLKDLGNLTSEYQVDMALLTNSYFIPIEEQKKVVQGENQKFKVKDTEKGNIFLRQGEPLMSSEKILGNRFGELYKIDGKKFENDGSFNFGSSTQFKQEQGSGTNIFGSKTGNVPSVSFQFGSSSSTKQNESQNLNVNQSPFRFGASTTTANTQPTQPGLFNFGAK